MTVATIMSAAVERLRRIMPDRLAGRFALLLSAALIVANVAALIVLATARDQLGRQARADQEIERIIALVPALEAVEPRLRQTIARDASTRVAEVDVGTSPLVPATPSDEGSASLAARLATALGPREVHAAILTRPDLLGQRLGTSERHRVFDGGEGEIVAVSVALALPTGSGLPTSWLNVNTRGGSRGGDVQEEVFFWVLGLSLLVVLSVGLVMVRQLTRPLARLAEAARAAGRGDRAARVPEEGAREMRDAATAFNAMQAQIARFEAERTRTLAAVGHDLRTPLTSLRIRAEMLDDEARGPMVRTLDEMTVMADGLVAFARGEGDGEERQAIDVSALLKTLCGDRGAEFAATDCPIVMGRPVALKRAIGNLIDNAIRYGNSARVGLSLKGHGAVIRIEDDGPGIPEDRLDSMFEPFVRGDDSRSLETGGAGLGLSIARTIIRSHGGSIVLTNRIGKGLRATVLIPVV